MVWTSRGEFAVLEVRDIHADFLVVRSGKEATVYLPKLEDYVQRIREELTTLDFDMKRLALDMLNIKVWLDDHNVEITGTIPVEDADVVTKSS